MFRRWKEKQRCDSPHWPLGGGIDPGRFSFEGQKSGRSPKQATASQFAGKGVSESDVLFVYVNKNFESKQYDKALEQFKVLHQHKPDDNVAAYYIKITENFFVKGKYPVESDDVGVAYNPEDGVFKLLQK